MPARKSGRLRFLAVMLFGLGLGLTPVVTPGLAGERIKFRNGHSLIVEKSRVEGEILYLTLPEGGEIGVPKALVAEIEHGHRAVSRRGSTPGASPRSVPFTELGGVQRMAREREGGAPLTMRVKLPTGGIRVGAGQRLTVGYRYKDSIDVADLGKAGRGPVIALWDRDKAGRVGEGYRTPSARPPAAGKNPSRPADLIPRIKDAGADGPR